MGESIRVCIIGCGMISAYHAKAIEAVDGMELLGFYDAFPDAAKKRAEETGTAFFETLEDVWNSEADAVTVCTPSGTHGKLCVDALRAGKHAIVEKPLALTEEDLQAIAEAERETGKVCAPISQHRCAGDVLRVKKLLEENALGALIGVNLSIRYHRDREYYSSSDWKGTIAMDGGLLMNQGIHAVDVMCYLNGCPDKVTGICRTIYHRIEAEDTAAAVFGFPDGKVGTLIATTAADSGIPWRMEIWGTEGNLTLEEDTLTVLNDRPLAEAAAGGSSRPEGIPVTEHISQLQNISDALRGIAPLDYTSAMASDTVRVILRITEGRGQ